MARLRLGRDSASNKAFERELALEILKSEKLRVTILIGVILSALLIVFIVAALGFKEFQSAFQGNFKGFITTFFTVVGLTLGCLVVERLEFITLSTNRPIISSDMQMQSIYRNEHSHVGDRDRVIVPWANLRAVHASNVALSRLHCAVGVTTKCQVVRVHRGRGGDRVLDTGVIFRRQDLARDGRANSYQHASSRN